jgi:uncharacterized protein (TIGR02271 family)
VISQDQLSNAMHATVYGPDGDKVGKAGQIYLDNQTDRPEWVTVSTGLFGGSESFVPLAEARLEGDRLVVPYDKDRIKDAPRIDSDQGQLSQEQEADLYRYYGLDYGDGPSDSGLASGAQGGTAGGMAAGTTSGTATLGHAEREDADRRQDDHDRQDTYPGVRTRGGIDPDAHTGTQTGAGTHTGTDTDADPGTVGRDGSGPTTDDAMTRSEEQLHVDKERGETGRARLRKYVVKDQETVTVPVEREEVRVQREPVTDANRGAALDGPAISEEEHEVTLHAERARVDKEAVPVERVRMDKETVRDEDTITDEVRKEQIEADVPQDDRRSGR